MPWLALVREAKNREDVVSIARDFAAHLSPAEIERLPPECRPGPIRSETDLQRYALLLAQHHGHGDAARVIMKLSGFFSAAAARLGEFGRPAPAPESPE